MTAPTESPRLGLHRNTMVSLIDGLEAQGLVKPMPHPDGRRAFAVTLTEKARDLLPAFEEQSPALEEDEVTGTLTAQEGAHCSSCFSGSRRPLACGRSAPRSRINRPLKIDS